MSASAYKAFRSINFRSPYENTTEVTRLDKTASISPFITNEIPEIRRSEATAGNTSAFAGQYQVSFRAKT